MIKIIVTVHDLPVNDKLTSIKVEVDGNMFKVIMGRLYLYMIDYNNILYYKVKQNITLLNLFSNTMSKSNDHAIQLIRMIQDVSLEQTKQNNVRKFIKNNKIK